MANYRYLRDACLLRDSKHTRPAYLHGGREVISATGTKWLDQKHVIAMCASTNAKILSRSTSVDKSFFSAQPFLHKGISYQRPCLETAYWLGCPGLAWLSATQTDLRALRSGQLGICNNRSAGQCMRANRFRFVACRGGFRH